MGKARNDDKGVVCEVKMGIIKKRQKESKGARKQSKPKRGKMMKVWCVRFKREQ